MITTIHNVTGTQTLVPRPPPARQLGRASERRVAALSSCCDAHRLPRPSRWT